MQVAPLQVRNFASKYRFNARIETEEVADLREIHHRNRIQRQGQSTNASTSGVTIKVERGHVAEDAVIVLDWDWKCLYNSAFVADSYVSWVIEQSSECNVTWSTMIDFLIDADIWVYSVTWTASHCLLSEFDRKMIARAKLLLICLAEVDPNSHAHLQQLACRTSVQVHVKKLVSRKRRAYSPSMSVTSCFTICHSMHASWLAVLLPAEI